MDTEYAFVTEVYKRGELSGGFANPFLQQYPKFTKLYILSEKEVIPENIKLGNPKCN